MNLIKKEQCKKITENGDNAYNTTGKELVDLIFMADYFQKNLDEVKIGTSYQEQLFSMYMRDPRFGQGRRDLGRKLMELSNVPTSYVVKAGRYDDLWKIARDEDIAALKNELMLGNELAKKWMPRLNGKDKKIAKMFCKMWKLTEKEYRALIKCNTTEHKLSYAEKQQGTALNELFKKGDYIHPLVDTIKFEEVPSLAMTKYIKAFSTRQDISPRFNEYMNAVKENKAKINTSTANVHDAIKVTDMSFVPQSVDKNTDILGKKIVEQETDGLELNCLCILDTSGSMGFLDNKHSLVSKATSVAHALSTNSTYCKGQLIGFSHNPQLMQIKGETLREQYQSMYTGDVANTDFGKVMKLLSELKEYPEYLIVLSDMEFDMGSNQSKETTMNIFKQYGAKTKIIWWNFNDRNRTSPELDEYGNVYMSGFDLQSLMQVPGIMNNDEYIDKILKEYASKINLIYLPKNDIM